MIFNAESTITSKIVLHWEAFYIYGLHNHSSSLFRHNHKVIEDAPIFCWDMEQLLPQFLFI